MAHHYQITGFMKLVELDSFKSGLIDTKRYDHYYNYRLTASSNPRSLAHEIAVHLDVDEDAMTFNACGETGRLDISRMENASGDKATPKQIENWKRGKIKLYSATYTTYLEQYQTAEWPQE